MSKIIGIDLGTTNSCVSVIEGGEPVVIANAEGARTTPSVVGFTKTGERLVGQVAKRQAITNPDRTVSSIKRHMGTDYKVTIDGKDYNPQQISAMILAKLKADAEAYLGEKVTDAVITVPAYFNDSQRQATKDAGTIAGLNVRRIINEPTAAALAYGADKDADQKIMVYDLGGGTFDVSIIEIGDGVIEVLSTCGDNHLGGDDFDTRLTNHLISQFKQQTRINLAKDPVAVQRVREAAEKAKIELSSASSANVNLPFITQHRGTPVHMDLTVTRTTFEWLTRDLVERTTIPVRTALNDAGITSSQLGKVLLVGGSTRIPAVQEHIRKLTEMQPSKGVNPDECVALGAAIQGATLGGGLSTVEGQPAGTGKEILLLDVTPLSLSIETVGGVATRLINRNATLPVHYSQIFSTAANFQTSVEIHVLQGERPMARDNKSIGKFRLTGIKRAPRGVPQIEVTFDLDANGILKVSARDLGTGRAQEIVIASSSNLSESEIQQAMADAAQYAAQDQEYKAYQEVSNQAEELIVRCKNALTICGKELDKGERKQIQNALANLEHTFKKSKPGKRSAGDRAGLSQATEQLKACAGGLLALCEQRTKGE